MPVIGSRFGGCWISVMRVPKADVRFFSRFLEAEWEKLNHGRKGSISWGHASILLCSHMIMLERSQTHMTKSKRRSILDAARKGRGRITGPLRRHHDAACGYGSPSTASLSARSFNWGSSAVQSTLVGNHWRQYFMQPQGWTMPAQRYSTSVILSVFHCPKNTTIYAIYYS
jgi:hypothetical protein